MSVQSKSRPVDSVKVAGCQLPEVPKDAARALTWIETYAAKADDQRVALACFPECYLQGYLTQCQDARDHAISLTSPEFGVVLSRLVRFRCAIVLGLIEIKDGLLFNTAVVIHRGKLLGRYRKTHLLPGEALFEPGTAYPTFDVDGLRFGINICYDTNFNEAAAALADGGARLIVCPANNMMPLAAADHWKPLHNEIRGRRAKETGLWLLSADITGERDGRISYGPTAVIDPQGTVVVQAPLLEPGMVVAEIPVSNLKTQAAEPN
jgi:predicted amidohydrolase